MSKFKALLLLGAFLSFAACKNQQVEAGPKSTTSIEIIVDPNAKAILSNFKDLFEASHPRLGDGSEVRIKMSEIADVEAAQRLSSGELKVPGWVVGPGVLSDFANANIKGLGAKQINCTPLFGSPIVLAARKLDASLFSPNDVSSAPEFDIHDFAKARLLEIQTRRVPSHFFSLSRPTPDRSGVGLSAALTLAHVPLLEDSVINQSTFSDASWLSKSRDINSAFGHFDDRPGAIAMNDASHRSGVVPALLTTESEVIRYNRGFPDRSLIALYPSTGSYWLDYQICSSDAGWNNRAQRVGLKMFADFMLLPTSTATIINSGFRPATKATFPESLQSLGVNLRYPKKNLSHASVAATSAMIKQWQNFQHPSLVMIVLDGTAIMEGDRFERSRAKIIEMFKTKRDSKSVYGVINVGYDATLVAPLSTDTSELTNQLVDLRAQGGASVADGIRLATSFFSKEGLETYRKILLVVTSGEDDRAKLTLASLPDSNLSENGIVIHYVSIVPPGANAKPERPTEISLLPRSDQLVYHSVEYKEIELKLSEIARFW